MAAMPLDYAQGIASQAIERFYFQQDKNLNVIFTSKIEHSKFVTVSAMSYFGFGENATQADITQIKSSLGTNNSNMAYNVTLDDIIPGKWVNIPGKPQYIELDLATTDKLSALKIWTGAKFPETFAVFVLPPECPSPSTTNNLTEWVYNAKQYVVDYVENRCYDNIQKTLDWENPYTIPLRDQRGNRVVIVWEKSPVDLIEVREFEVIKVPNNPVAISFAGQWLDAETNLYYQINRYRLAGSNKFISPDPLGYFDGNNLYAYAHNNPLEWHDPDGQWAHIVAGAGIGAILGGGMYALNCWISGEEFSWAEFGVSVLAGAASGAIAAALLPVNPILAGAVAGAVGGAIMEGGITYIRTGDFKASLVAAGKGALWGAAAGAFAGGLGIFSGSSSGWMAGLAKSVASGAGTGGLFGGLRRATEVYMATGDWTTALSAARNSAFRGTIMGGIAGAAGYSLARSVNAFKSNNRDADYVYRVLRPDENPKQGIFAKDPMANRTPNAQVLCGSRCKTQYISTTKSLEIAQNWNQKTGGRIVEIDLNKVHSPTLDLTNPEIAIQYLSPGRSMNYARSSQEVLIENYIPSSAVKQLHY
jgi:RHS repeat-associated protein